MPHPTVLVYTKDDRRRRRLAHHISEKLNGRMVAIESAAEVERVSTSFAVLGAILDMNSHDPNARTVRKAVQRANWDVMPPIIYLYDESESTQAFAAEERANWVSRRRSNGTVIKMLMELLESNPLELGFPPASESASSSSAAFDTLSKSTQHRFWTSLHEIESKLNDGLAAVELIPDLRETTSMAFPDDFGLESTSSLIGNSPPMESEDLLRSAISQLRSMAGGADMPAQRYQVIVMSQGAEIATKLGEEIAGWCEIRHMVDADALAVSYESMGADAFVVVDDSPTETSRALQMLRYLRVVNRAPIIIQLVEDRPEQPDPTDYGVYEFVGEHASLQELGATIKSALSVADIKRPLVAVLDITGELVSEVRRWLRGTGIMVEGLSKPNELNVLCQQSDMLVLAEHYPKFSGLDVFRSVCQKRRFLRPPVVIATSKPAIGELSERLYGAGIDEIIHPQMGDQEIHRRIQRLIEAHRLRVRVAETDEITGARHVCSLSRELELQLHFALQEDRWLSLIMVDIDGFDPIRSKYGSPAATILLRGVADHLASLFGADRIFRGWGDRFFVIPGEELDEDTRRNEIEVAIRDFKRITFRTRDGRGFYASLTTAHLLIPAIEIDARNCLGKLSHVLEIAKQRTRSEVLTARMDPDNIVHFPDRQTAPTSRARWRPVVLTHSDD